MTWFCKVLSWHLACLALALLMLGMTVITAKVAADGPPPSTPSCGGSGCCCENCPPFIDCEDCGCVNPPGGDCTGNPYPCSYNCGC